MCPSEISSQSPTHTDTSITVRSNESIITVPTHPPTRTPRIQGRACPAIHFPRGALRAKNTLAPFYIRPYIRISRYRIYGAITISRRERGTGTNARLPCATFWEIRASGDMCIICVCCARAVSFTVVQRNEK